MGIGVLGGTFDPVHIGHVKMAEEARVSLHLSRVILVPAGQPLLKPAHPITPAEHRLRMLDLALAGKPGLIVSTVEIERAGPSYTVDTMAGLKAQYGADDLFFILGWDSLAHLPEWRDPSRLIGLCYLVAVPRPGCARPDLAALEAYIPSISRRVVFLKKPRVNISASAIRERAARGLPLGRLVPGPVADYIKRHGLYTTF